MTRTTRRRLQRALAVVGRYPPHATVFAHLAFELEAVADRAEARRAGLPEPPPRSPLPSSVQRALVNANKLCRELETEELRASELRRLGVSSSFRDLDVERRLPPKGKRK